ncbi:hypothetical protein HK099_003587 [Clydaea vesicula]|uniref:Uncharacterized protein n=1 Tax=Clydaea vesicula TaxID=447962 RepID=A0AAD5U1M4_9FUNG|nr:hypothetical protein HK099_003587 [Clydaea vesicula]
MPLSICLNKVVNFKVDFDNADFSVRSVYDIAQYYYGIGKNSTIGMCGSNTQNLVKNVVVQSVMTDLRSNALPMMAKYFYRTRKYLLGNSTNVEINYLITENSKLKFIFDDAIDKLDRISYEESSTPLKKYSFFNFTDTDPTPKNIFQHEKKESIIFCQKLLDKLDELDREIQFFLGKIDIPRSVDEVTECLIDSKKLISPLLLTHIRNVNEKIENNSRNFTFNQLILENKRINELLARSIEKIEVIPDGLNKEVLSDEDYNIKKDSFRLNRREAIVHLQALEKKTDEMSIKLREFKNQFW